MARTLLSRHLGSTLDSTLHLTVRTITTAPTLLEALTCSSHQDTINPNSNMLKELSIKLIMSTMRQQIPTNGLSISTTKTSPSRLFWELFTSQDNLKLSNSTSSWMVSPSTMESARTSPSTGSLMILRMVINSGLIQMVSKCKRESKMTDSHSNSTNQASKMPHGTTTQSTLQSLWETLRRMAVHQMKECRSQSWMIDLKLAQPLSKKEW